ncbi:MAG TPA: DUF2520 domain-containing protein [Chitinophagales bacterium]|nr:DUF2520 domain-containing protein [Chitinophagales bacterium]
MNPSKHKLVIVGAGNVGFHLGQRLHQAGYDIKQVFSLTPHHGKSLGEKVNSTFTNDVAQITPDADVYIVCVKDDAMKNVYNVLPVKNRIVLHTAGSVVKNVSSRTDLHQGVLYPLQSFNRSAEVSWENVPVFVDGDNDSVISIASELGYALTQNVKRANDEQRLKVHIAAVFANNFSNHCLAIGQKLLEQNGYDFDVLKPLVETTFKRLQHSNPSDVQTGPAKRGDDNTVDKHLNALVEHRNWKELYRYLSDDIRKLQ